MTIIRGSLLSLLLISNVLSQSPCDRSNAQCQFHYYNHTCQLYTANGYEKISDQDFGTIENKCFAYWELQYTPNELNNKCTSKDKLIWPVGQCGCPLCDCPSDSFCCYESPEAFDISQWTQLISKVQCGSQQNMCYWSINVPDNQTSVSCSDEQSLNTRLSLDTSSPFSTILSENNNTACYTFIESDNRTETVCFCGENGCNDISNIVMPDLTPKNACYVSDSLHSEQFWSNYVYEDKTCEMCGVSLASSQSGDKVEFSCKSRAVCKAVLSESGAYNDNLSGCAVTSNSTSECCCDPSIDGNLCNEQFVNTQQQSPSQNYFECWKADFLQLTDENWDSNAKRINCSYENYKFCYIQSFGNERYTSNCETESNCGNIKNLENNKRICCNDTNFCNEPSIFSESKSSAPHNSFCLVIIWTSYFSLF